MKGSNTIDLNQATMVEVVQYYFDNVLFKMGASVNVQRVEKNTNPRKGQETFIVEIEERENDQHE